MACMCGDSKCPSCGAAQGTLLQPDYQRGPVTLYCGDCADVLPHLEAVDAVVADPPYGVGKAAWDNAVPPQHVLDGCLRLASNVGWFGAAPPTAQAAILALRPLPTRTYVWWNTFTLLSTNGALWQWQPFYTWGKFTGLKRDVLQMASNYQADTRFSRHPTQKPTPLMELLVTAACEAGGTVCDCYMGSGTTGVACIRAGRRFVGVERDPEHFETAVKRIDAELRQGRFDFEVPRDQ